MSEASGRQGLFAGWMLGIIHCGLLASGGLYADSLPAEVGRSLLWHLIFFGVLGWGSGLLLGAIFSRLRPGFRFAHAPLLLFLYGSAWGLMLFRQGGAGRYFALGLFLMGIALLLHIVSVAKLKSMPARIQPISWMGGLLCAGLLFVLSAAPPVRVEAVAPAAVDLDLAERARKTVAGSGRNLLLLSVDTLRADHLGSYGHERETSPAIDRLAATGVQFLSAYCPRPKTSPSVATMLTGTWPARHGIHTPMRRLADHHLTLAEMLSQVGYRTGAVVTNGNLYPEFAFDQGFATYDYGHKEANEGRDLALAWLGEHGESLAPWMLWVHMTDPHLPYDPPAPYDELFAREGMKKGERMGALYDGEIRFTDDSLGAIIAWLDARPELAARTVVAFTADHGESFGEHGEWFEHGINPYEPAARVPLILRLPGVLPASSRPIGVVQGVDLVPTLLDLLGLPWPEAVQGNSLLPLALGLSGDGPTDFAFLEAGYGRHNGPGRTRSLRRAESKFVERLRDWAMFPRRPLTLVEAMDARLEGGLAPDEIYDLRADPLELKNLRDERPGALRRDRRAMGGWIAKLGTDAAVDAAAGASLDAATLESLKSLGYIE